MMIFGRLFQKDINKRKNEMRTLYHRTLPIMELYSDRWKKAAELGWGDGSNVYDSAIVMGDVSVGRECWIGPNTLLDGTGGGLSIGNHCSISAGVQIYTHDSVKECLSNGKCSIEKEKVMIGNNCYIGPMCIISKGVVLGDRCVVGCNSFVNSAFEANSIVAGTPARKIGEVCVGEDGNVELNYFHNA